MTPSGFSNTGVVVILPFLYDAFRVLKSGESGRGSLVCFTRWDVQQTFIDAMKLAGFQVKSEVIWDKVFHGMGDTKAAFAPSHENIVFAVKGKFSFPGHRPKDLITFQKINSSQMVHPTEKPVGLLANLITSVTKPGTLPLCRERLHPGRRQEDRTAVHRRGAGRRLLSDRAAAR